MQVSAGNEHSLVLVEVAKAYSFRAGDRGRLGHGDQRNRLLPKLIVALQGKRAVHVSAGEWHSLVLLVAGARWSPLLKEDGRVVTLGGVLLSEESESESEWGHDGVS